MENKFSTNIKIFVISVAFIIAAYEILIHFDTISKNTFVWFDYFDKRHTPYYGLFWGIVVFFILTFFVTLFKNTVLLKLWLIKAFVTLVLMMIYEAHYSLDAYVYFGRAVLYKNMTWHNQHGTMFVVYFNHLLSYIVGNSYYAMKLVSSFIGFLGLIFLYNSYKYIIARSGLIESKLFVYAFFLFPSIIFWSSILGKDPLNLFFVGMFIYAFVHIIDRFSFGYLLMIVLSVWLVSYIRTWYAVIMVMSMFLYFIKLNSLKNFLFFLLVLPIFLVLAQQFLLSQGVDSIDTLFVKMTEITTNLAYGQSTVTVNKIKNFGDYMLYFLPNLFTALFRPMPWDIRNAFTFIAAIENMILLYLTYQYILRHWRQVYSNRYLKFLIVFIFSWAVFYVVISPANLGGAVRFKLQVLPEMLIIIGVAMAMSRQRESQKELEQCAA